MKDRETEELSSLKETKDHDNQIQCMTLCGQQKKKLNRV